MKCSSKASAVSCRWSVVWYVPLFTPDIGARKKKLVQIFRARKFFIQFGRKKKTGPKGFYFKLKWVQGGNIQDVVQAVQTGWPARSTALKSKGTARVNISGDEHSLCDLVHDKHANHLHGHSKPGPYDTEPSLVFVVTVVSYKIDVKAIPLEDALFKHYL